jgi:hypothetical protein
MRFSVIQPQLIVEQPVAEYLSGSIPTSLMYTHCSPASSFVNTLEDNVRFRGAPSKLVSDRAQVEISGRALELLRVYAISSWQSEPHLHHQNYAERKIQQLKQMTNTIIDRTVAPPEVWLLCLMYVAYVLNHTWSDNIKNIPLTAMLGITVDTSILLRYHFWQRVYIKAIEHVFPSDSKERLGHVIVGFFVRHSFDDVGEVHSAMTILRTLEAIPMLYQIFPLSHDQTPISRVLPGNGHCLQGYSQNCLLDCSGYTSTTSVLTPTNIRQLVAPQSIAVVSLKTSSVATASFRRNILRAGF